MNKSELIKYYIENFKKAPNSKITRKLYNTMEAYGEGIGINLSKKFLEELLNDYKDSKQEEDLDKKILKDMQEFIKRQAVSVYVREIREKEKNYITGIRKKDGMYEYTGFYIGIPYRVGECRSEKDNNVKTLIYPGIKNILCEFFEDDYSPMHCGICDMERSPGLQKRLEDLRITDLTGMGDYDASDPDFHRYIKTAQPKKEGVKYEFS